MRNAYTFHFDLKILEEYYSVVLTFSLLDKWSTINFAYRCGRKNEGGMKSLYSLNHMNIYENDALHLCGSDVLYHCNMCNVDMLLQLI